jgi:hypothetical protein
MAEEIVSCRQAGMNDHLAKPIDIPRPETILAEIAGRFCPWGSLGLHARECRVRIAVLVEPHRIKCGITVRGRDRALMPLSPIPEGMCKSPSDL